MASKQQVSFLKKENSEQHLSQDKLTLYYHIQNFARVD